MRRLLALIFFVFLAFKVQGAIVGNPSSPGIFTCGLFSTNQTIYLRGGYFFDHIYEEEFKDENKLLNTPESKFKLTSQGATFTLNFKNRFDLYGHVGAAKMNLDDQVCTRNHLFWSVGMTILFLKIQDFDFSLDGKYFRSSQEAKSLLVNHEVYPIVTPHFGFRIEEYQASLSVSYKTTFLIPYVGATYLHSTIHPYPSLIGLIRFPPPNEEMISDFISNNLKNKNSWGAVVGVGIVSKKMVLLNIESRFIDQNAVNASLEIRF